MTVHICLPPDLDTWDLDEDWTCSTCGQDWFVGHKNLCHSCYRHDGRQWEEFGTGDGEFPLVSVRRGGIKYAYGEIGPPLGPFKYADNVPKFDTGPDYAAIYAPGGWCAPSGTLYGHLGNTYDEYVSKWVHTQIRNHHLIEEMYLVNVFARFRWPLYLAWKLGYRGMEQP